MSMHEYILIPCRRIATIKFLIKCVHQQMYLSIPCLLPGSAKITDK